MTGPVPIAALGRRMVEQGRLRMGKKDNSRAGRTSIETWRLTSPSEQTIRVAAEKFGGTPRPWSDPKASPRNQWEVETPASTLRVWLPDDPLTVRYEMWTGGGCARRCDGEVCEVAVATEDGAEPDQVPCICDAKGAMDCKPFVRLRVILPDLPFGGAWRMETKGWNAVHEFPGMIDLIAELQSRQGGGLVDALLSIEKRSRVANGRTSNFVVPVLSLPYTPEQILAGQAAVASLGPAAVATAGEHAALMSGEERPALAAVPDPDDDVVDAEIVDAVGTIEMEEVLAMRDAPRWSLEELAAEFGDELDRKVTALIEGTAKWSAHTEGRVVKA